MPHPDEIVQPWQGVDTHTAAYTCWTPSLPLLFWSEGRKIMPCIAPLGVTNTYLSQALKVATDQVFSYPVSF